MLGRAWGGGWWGSGRLGWGLDGVEHGHERGLAAGVRGQVQGVGAGGEGHPGRDVDQRGADGGGAGLARFPAGQHTGRSGQVVGDDILETTNYFGVNNQTPGYTLAVLRLQRLQVIRWMRNDTLVLQG